MEDSLLITFLQDHTKIATRTEQAVVDMNKRLFGNGQPGDIQNIREDIEKIKATQLEVKDDLGKRITNVDETYRLDRRWLTGALAILGIILTALTTVIGFYLKYFHK